jgi:hypothetical protein
VSSSIRPALDGSTQQVAEGKVVPAEQVLKELWAVHRR